MCAKSRQVISSEDHLEQFKSSIVLLQGVFEDSFFDRLREKQTKDIFVLEGRPTLEAAELSCQQLIKRGLRPTLIADNMAGFLFYKNLVKEIWLSYQVADKDGALCYIGSLILGVLGNRHKVPVNLFPNDKKLVLLGREKEILYFNGEKVAPPRVRGYVPLAEWVPTKYITKMYSVN